MQSHGIRTVMKMGIGMGMGVISVGVGMLENVLWKKIPIDIKYQI